MSSQLLDGSAQVTLGQLDREQRWDPGVRSYASMGYYDPDYVPKETDVLAVFRVTPAAGRRPDRGRCGGGR